MPYASETANYILYSPLDSNASTDHKISELLTSEEFLKECYVIPQFQKDISTEITDDNLESYDYIIKYDEIKDMRNRQELDYKNFLKWLDNRTNPKVYTISGNAGTGKTTFIHRLKFENPNKDWIIFDMVKASDFIDWFNGIETNISNFDKPYNKMYSVVLDELRNIIFNYTGDNIDVVYRNIKKIIHTFQNNFKNIHIRGKEYFNELAKISTFNNLKFVNAAARCTQKYFDDICNKHNSDAKLLFRSALDVLIITYCCVNEKKDHVIVFDNIERFIAHDEIYNKDIDAIRREMGYYSKEIKDKSKYYNSYFKFILGMRTSSIRMRKGKLHSLDELASDLNLTNWFLIDDIISSKIKWYTDHDLKTLNIDTLTQIICDLRPCNKHELTGLQLFINPLFNENIRLISDFIGIVIETSSNEKFIKCYNDLWNEDTPVSRFAARTIIRGLIYQELNNNDNLFHHLQLLTEVEAKEKNKDTDNYGLNYTRKILTILYNKSNAVTLEHIIATICGIKTDIQKYWKEEIPEKNKISIAEVLFFMNSYNRRDNDWIQFVDLEITSQNHTVAADDIQTLKELIDKDLNNISLRIMPAGEAYLRYIVQSFEYFSFRFYKNHVDSYTPLFCTVPSLDEFKKCANIKELPCYVIINYVKQNAFKCIENIINNGDIPLDLGKNLKSKNHIQRIIDHHQGYIEKFIYYIREKYSEHMDIENIHVLINECIAIKNEYNNYRKK